MVFVTIALAAKVTSHLVPLERIQSGNSVVHCENHHEMKATISSPTLLEPKISKQERQRTRETNSRSGKGKAKTEKEV